MKLIKIAVDYSDTPLGRYPADGNFNGQRFREEFLVPALKAEDKTVVDIDDVEGYGSSFLDEAFGGLVREGHFSSKDLKQKLQIQCQNSDYSIYANLIWKYINEARAKKKSA